MQPQDGGVERDVCDKLLMLCDMFGVTLDDLVGEKFVRIWDILLPST